jgi:hypothetical protein
LLEARQAIPQQNAAVLPVRGPGQPKGIPRQIAEETGLSVGTVRRALNPPEPKNPLPDHDVVTVQFNSLVAAWNRAGREARDMPSCWRCGRIKFQCSKMRQWKLVTANPDNLSKFLVGASCRWRAFSVVGPFGGYDCRQR